jgi:hypothetical protein
MEPVRQVGLGALLLVFGGTAAMAQQAISARSGMVHYIEGKVYAGDQQIDEKFGNFPQVKENQVLRTEEGRAEVLLTPGVFLRVGEHSSFRMITNRLIDTRLEFLSGSMILESDDMLKDNSVTVVAKDATVHLRKPGIYRFDSESAQLKVAKGMVEVETKGQTFELKEGKLLNLTADMAVAKFDPKESDALSRWSYRRAEAVAMANVSSAKSLKDSGGYLSYAGYGPAGYGPGGFGGYYPCTGLASSLWAFNPYYGMYTYVPCSGRYGSPYGFLFWSPVTVGRVFAPRPVYNPNWGRNADGGFSASHGYSSMGATSSGYSGAVSAASSGSVPMSSASPGPSAGASSSASAGVSRGGGGGGGGGHR